MTAVAICILILYLISLFIIIIVVKTEKRVDRLETETSEEMKEYNLKPCPFCGGEASLERVRGDDHYSYVYCKKCFCSTKLLACHTQYDCDELVIKMWNRRSGEQI